MNKGSISQANSGARLLLFALFLLFLVSCGADGDSGNSAATNPSSSASAGQISAPVSAPAAAPPSAPAGVVATAGNGEITISWQADPTASSYNIYYLTYPGVTVANSKQRTMAVSGVPITGLENTVTYYFKVTAVNNAGESAASSEVSATPMPPVPGIPGAFTLMGDINSATISWQEVPYATSYNVYYGTSPGLTTMSPLSKKGLALTNLTIDGLTKAPGHYYFMVTAANVSGEGPPSVERAAVAKGIFKDIAGGEGHSSVSTAMEPTLAYAGTVWGWGDNSKGQLGMGASPLETWTAQQTDTISSVIGLAAGAQHTVALTRDNAVWDWGWNDFGQIGDARSTTDLKTPKAEIPFAPRAMTAIAAAQYHTMALKDDGTVWTWGSNNMAQLGYVSVNCKNPVYGQYGWSCNNTPTQVAGITGSVIAIAAGELHSLAVTNDLTVWAWGRNDAGQLGTTLPNCNYLIVPELSPDIGFTYTLGTTQHTRSSCSTIPVQVDGLPGDVIAVTAGDYHSVALMKNGTVWTWGSNIWGQLGYTPTLTCQIDWAILHPCSVAPTQVQVTGFENIIAIAAGAGHTLALKSDGTVWAWGWNDKGQLGNGLTTADFPNQTPTQVPGLTGITAIAAGTHHSLAIKNDGTVWAWGYNNHGQLGNNSRSDSKVPVKVQGLPGPVLIVPGL